MSRKQIDRVINEYNSSGRTANKIRKTSKKKIRQRHELIEDILDLYADMPGSHRQWPLHRYVVKAVHGRSGPLTRDCKLGKKGYYTYDVECYFTNTSSCVCESSCEFSDQEIALLRAFDAECTNGRVPKKSKSKWALMWIARVCRCVWCGFFVAYNGDYIVVPWIWFNTIVVIVMIWTWEVQWYIIMIV